MSDLLVMVFDSELKADHVRRGLLKKPMNPNVGWIVTWQGIAGPAMPYLSIDF